MRFALLSIVLVATACHKSPSGPDDLGLTDAAAPIDLTSASADATAPPADLTIPPSDAAPPPVGFSLFAARAYDPSAAAAVATGDLDGDGKLDLVTANYTEATTPSM